MQVIHSVDEMQKVSLGLKKSGKKIGFVPTMGYLHEGHLSLVDLIADQVDVLILSIFLNPIQFSKGEDLDQYPTDWNRDIELCNERGVEIVFAPQKTDIYDPEFSTYITEHKLSGGLCGGSRPDHFQGVTTICTKLFNICNPDILALGQKDAQQVAVLHKMIVDLNFPIEVKVGDILREPDGLAMSSRNSYLSENQRQEALYIYESLQKAEELVKAGVLDVVQIRNEVIAVLNQGRSIRIDYVEIVQQESMKPVSKVIPNSSMIVIAVWVEKIRLIDNHLL